MNLTYSIKFSYPILTNNPKEGLWNIQATVNDLVDVIPLFKLQHGN